MKNKRVNLPYRPKLWLSPSRVIFRHIISISSADNIARCMDVFVESLANLRVNLCFEQNPSHKVM